MYLDNIPDEDPPFLRRALPSASSRPERPVLWEWLALNMVLKYSFFFGWRSGNMVLVFQGQLLRLSSFAYVPLLLRNLLHSHTGDPQQFIFLAKCKVICGTG